MRITNGIIASCILTIIAAADHHEVMRCKARPGCHLAKCDPGPLSPSLNANEYPVTCVRTSAQDGKEYNELKREMRIIRAEMETLKTKSDQSNEELLKEMGDLKIQLSKSDQSNKALSNALQRIAMRSCDGAKLESALARNDTGGVFHLHIPTVGLKGVFCDVIDDGGNWIVFQRRMHGDVDFYRNWDDYVYGFGDLQGDHWLGLEALHRMTKGGNMEMKIKMITRDGIHWVAKYSSFNIGPGSDNYRLHVSGYSGNATGGDRLLYHNDQQFSTMDADHDGSSSWKCASRFEGGWWYNSCYESNLNGNFHKTGWKGLALWDDSTLTNLRFTEMKFRKRAGN